MTDEQIIKAVDVCRTGTCKGCPYHELYTASCINKLMEDVLDLINRQKAEIEYLKSIKFPHGIQVEVSKKIESEIKSKAIKEFAERLKSKVNDLEFRTKTHRKTVPTKICDDNTNWVMHECVPEEIDNLVKEMTEAHK